MVAVQTFESRKQARCYDFHSITNVRSNEEILRYWCDTLNIGIIPPTDLEGFCLGRGNTSLSPSSLSIPVPSELLWSNMEPMFCDPLLRLSPDDTNTTIARGKKFLSLASFPGSLFLSPLSRSRAAGRTETLTLEWGCPVRSFTKYWLNLKSTVAFFFFYNKKNA